MIMMAGVDQHARPRTRLAGNEQRHAPVGKIGVIKGRLERLVFHQQSLIVAQGFVHFRKRFGHPFNALANALRARVVRTIGQPHGDVARTKRLRDGHGLQQMIDCHPANRAVGIADGSELVLLALKEIGIDGAGADAGLGLQIQDSVRVAETFRQIPGHMQCEGRRDAGERVYMCGVGKLLLDGRRRFRLQELTEARAGIGKSPRGEFYPQRVERLKYAFLMGAQCLHPHIEMISQLEFFQHDTPGTGRLKARFW